MYKVLVAKLGFGGHDRGVISSNGLNLVAV